MMVMFDTAYAWYRWESDKQHEKIVFAGSKGNMTTSAEAGDLIPFDT